MWTPSTPLSEGLLPTITTDPSTSLKVINFASGGYLACAASNKFVLSGDFTIEFWIKGSPDNANYASLLSIGNVNQTPSVLMRTSEGRQARVALNVGPGMASSEGYITQSLLLNDTWNFVSWQRTGSKWNVYINGNKYFTTDNIMANSLNTIGNGLHLGISEGEMFSNTWFTGAIGGLRIVRGMAVSPIRPSKLLTFS